MEARIPELPLDDVAAPFASEEGLGHDEWLAHRAPPVAPAHVCRPGRRRASADVFGYGSVAAARLRGRRRGSGHLQSWYSRGAGVQAHGWRGYAAEYPGPATHSASASLPASRHPSGPVSARSASGATPSLSGAGNGTRPRDLPMPIDYSREKHAGTGGSPALALSSSVSLARPVSPAQAMRRSPTCGTAAAHAVAGLLAGAVSPITVASSAPKHRHVPSEAEGKGYSGAELSHEAAAPASIWHDTEGSTDADSVSCALTRPRRSDGAASLPSARAVSTVEAVLETKFEEAKGGLTLDMAALRRHAHALRDARRALFAELRRTHTPDDESGARRDLDGGGGGGGSDTGGATESKDAGKGTRAAAAAHADDSSATGPVKSGDADAEAVAEVEGSAVLALTRESAGGREAFDNARASVGLMDHVVAETDDAIEHIGAVAAELRRRWAAIHPCGADNVGLRRKRQVLHCYRLLRTTAAHCVARATWGQGLASPDDSKVCMEELLGFCTSGPIASLMAHKPTVRARVLRAREWVVQNKALAALACAGVGLAVGATAYACTVPRLQSGVSEQRELADALREEGKQLDLEQRADAILRADASVGSPRVSGTPIQVAVERVTRASTSGVSRLVGWAHSMWGDGDSAGGAVQSSSSSSSPSSSSATAAIFALPAAPSVQTALSDDLTYDAIHAIRRLQMDHARVRSLDAATRALELAREVPEATAWAARAATYATAAAGMVVAGLSVLDTESRLVLRSRLAEALATTRDAAAARRVDDAAVPAAGPGSDAPVPAPEPRVSTRELMRQLRECAELAAQYTSSLCRHVGADRVECSCCLGGLTPLQPLIRSGSHPTCGRLHHHHRGCFDDEYLEANGCPQCRRPVAAVVPTHMETPLHTSWFA